MYDEACADRNTDPSKVQREAFALVEELRERRRFLEGLLRQDLERDRENRRIVSPVRYRRGSAGHTEAMVA
jgi:hypothetical protein